MMPPSSTAEQLCRRFTLAEIKSATGDFSDAYLIGKGGFGKVYKGLVDNGSTSTTVAMKRLASNSNQGEREFAAEMETLIKFRHRNLVSLIGYCNEQGEMILVYEYMANGTLADHLYNLSRNNGNGDCGGGGASLTWIQRLEICIGAARGLDYLHSGCSIIHRDVKSTNILLDEKFVAKVSDFGLAKHLNADNLESHVIASVKGSFGYFDPCYFTTGRLTRASDTYAFGVVLLEVLSGKPAVDPRLAENELCLTMWAQEKFRNGKIDQIVASNLRGEISDDCLKTFVGVAKRCLHREPKKRLTMTRAVVQLEFALEQQQRKGSSHRLYFRTLNAFWNRVIPSGSTQEDHNQSSVVVPFIPLDKIEKITNGFSWKCLITKRYNVGSLFHGVLKKGQHAAIKKLYMKLSDQEFLKEVSLLSSLKHENVVQLLGYCMDGDQKILAYEFAPRGSLHDILQGQRDLSWTRRIEIAVGAAKGLHYVHENALIYQNVKSRNVLLFDDETVKIAEFRLSFDCPCLAPIDYDCHPNAFPSGCDHHPPEYKRTGHTQKGDVYNFGVVLLELLTGENKVTREVVKHLSEDKVEKIVDARLKRKYPPKAVVKMADVAASCLRDSADSRPDMSTVVSDLQIAKRLSNNETIEGIRAQKECLFIRIGLQSR